MRRVVLLYGSVPIPVQHRIEVFALEAATGVFGRNAAPQIGDWIVYDHSTGIWYGSAEHFDASDEPVMGTRWPLLRKDLRFAERFMGVVAACIVMGDRATSSTSRPTQTALHIDAV